MLPMIESPDSGYPSLPGMMNGYNMSQRLEEKGEHVVIKKELSVNTCLGCRHPITDRHLLKVGGEYFWHLHCLRCSRCQSNLDEFATCFMRDHNVFCRSCFTSEFAAPCSACYYPFTAGDWIRRVGGYIYHLHCFVCYQCQIPLSTGVSFTMVGHQLRCKNHSITGEPEPQLTDLKPAIGAINSEDACFSLPAIKSEDACSTGTNSSDDTYNHSLEGGSPKRRRPRTTFTERQMDILKASFRSNEMPDPQRMQNIADAAGLTKKVTQVWFQNARTRQRKKSIVSSTGNVPANAMAGDYGIAQMMLGSNAVGAASKLYQLQSPRSLEFHFN